MKIRTPSHQTTSKCTITIVLLVAYHTFDHNLTSNMVSQLFPYLLGILKPLYWWYKRHSGEKCRNIKKIKSDKNNRPLNCEQCSVRAYNLSHFHASSMIN